MTMRRDRRRFLLQSASALGALLAAHSGLALALPRPTPKRRMLGIAVVGLGSFASFAMPRIQRSTRARIVALVSGVRAKAERHAAEFGLHPDGIYDYGNFERLAENPAVHAVYLCLPVGLHAEFAIRAMRAGKHVLCEKTLAADSAQAECMLEVARETGRQLLVAYRTYFGPAYAAVRERIDGGAYGKVVHLDMHKGFPIAHPPEHWRFDRRLAGGGSLVDIGVYSVQAARLFSGEMPSSVTAQIHSPSGDPRFREVEDSVVFTLRFPSGVVASGSSSWRYQLQNRLRVGLERGWLDLEPASPALGQVLRVRHEGHSQIETLPLAQEDQLPLMFDHCASVMLDGERPIVPAIEGLKDLRIIEAIYAAAASGRETAVDVTGLQ